MMDGSEATLSPRTTLGPHSGIEFGIIGKRRTFGQTFVASVWHCVRAYRTHGAPTYVRRKVIIIIFRFRRLSSFPFYASMLTQKSQPFRGFVMLYWMQA